MNTLEKNKQKLVITEGKCWPAVHPFSWRLSVNMEEAAYLIKSALKPTAN